jgi:hypothetical protein
MAMNWPLALAAVLEAITGLALIILPSICGRLLLGAEISGPGLIVGRVAGFALLALGMACWPVRRSGSLAPAHFIPAQAKPALRAMLTYNALVSGYLIFLGLGGRWVGILLWPSVGVHGLLTLLLARESLKPAQIQNMKG